METPNGGNSPHEEDVVLDDLDRRIVEILLERGPLPSQELGAEIGLSKSPTAKRLASLRRRGLIGDTVRVDPKALGVEAVALLFVSIDQPQFDHTLAKLVALPGVQWVGAVSGANCDYVALVRSADQAAIGEVIFELLEQDGVTGVNSSFVLREVMKQPGGVWPGPEG